MHDGRGYMKGGKGGGSRVQIELRNRNGERARPACRFGRLAQTIVTHLSSPFPRARMFVGRGFRRAAENHTPAAYAPRAVTPDTTSTSEFEFKARSLSGKSLLSPASRGEEVEPALENRRGPAVSRLKRAKKRLVARGTRLLFCANAPWIQRNAERRRRHGRPATS